MTIKRRICKSLSRAKSSSAATLATSCDGSGAAVVIAAASVILLLSSSTNNYSSYAEKKEGGDERLDVYLMDRISKKSYLNYHSTVVSSSRHHQQQQEQETTKHQLVHQHLSEGGTKMSHVRPEDTRPKGVPSRLRLLTVDVPEFKRDAFQHGVVCQLPSQIFDTPLTFLDGVAPSKPMNKTLGHNERTGTRDSRKPILQKSLAKQLYYCHYPQHDHSKSGKSRSLNHVHVRSEQKKMQSPTSSSKTYPSVQIGAEILEASVLDLNPNNIRRFYTSTSKKYHYDPGKYTNNDTDTTHEQHFGDASGIADADEAENEDIARETNNNNTSSEDQFEEKDIDDPDYERTAPWNQYAWLEEMHLRIHGLVPFGAPMQRAHIISQWMYGRIYHQSIPISSSRGGWLSWLWWPSWSGSYAVGSPRYRTSWDGVDGEGESRLIGDNSRNVERNGILPRIFSSRVVLNRASNKP